MEASPTECSDTDSPELRSREWPDHGLNAAWPVAERGLPVTDCSDAQWRRRVLMTGVVMNRVGAVNWTESAGRRQVTTESDPRRCRRRS